MERINKVLDKHFKIGYQVNCATALWYINLLLAIFNQAYMDIKIQKYQKEAQDFIDTFKGAIFINNNIKKLLTY